MGDSNLATSEDPCLVKSLKGHKKAVTDVCFNPETKQFASSSEDNSLMIWNMDQSIRSYEFSGHSDSVTSVEFSSDGKLLASSSKDQTVRFWVPTIRGESYMFKAHTSAVNCVSFSPDNKRVLTGSNDKSVKIWEVSKKQFVSSLTGHNNWVRCAKYSPEGNFVVSGADDRTVRVWDPKTGLCEHVFVSQTSSPTYLSVHGNNNTVAVAMDSGSVRVYDVRNKKLQQHYTLHEGSTTCVSWHPTANYFSSCGKDGKIRIVDVMEGRPLYTLGAHEGAITTSTGYETEYEVILENDGPIVAGAAINFTASVYDGNNLATGIDLKYDWKDRAIHQHTRQTENQNATDSWLVTYNASLYPFGSYVMEVVVVKCLMWGAVCYQIGSARSEFEITDTLNGVLQLEQNNKTRPNNFVSNTETVLHTVDLKKSDLDYIKAAPTVLTYWFVDCTYYGITTDLKFPFNYTVVDEIHFIEALVMADFTPLPPPTTLPPSTTTVKPNSTTTTPKTTTVPPNSTTTTPKTTTIPPNNTTTNPSSTTPKPIKPEPNVTTTSTVKSVIKRSVGDPVNRNNTSNISMLVNSKLVPFNLSLPFVCNGTQLTSNPAQTYGFFSKRIEVKAPLSNINVNGNNWIQPGDLLSLKISCTGSKNIDYCVKYVSGEYNITGNETCDSVERLDTCNFRIKRYLWHPKTTIIIIIQNEVSRIITPVTVNIYKVNKQAQLSVIVVPVAFTLVAVVLIVFGVAYYIQNRNRFIIEVADFNFSQQYSDMEYKTFRERLRDSFAYAFSRGPCPGSSEVPVWPPGQKYGSMT